MLVFLICQSGLVGQQCKVLSDGSERRVPPKAGVVVESQAVVRIFSAVSDRLVGL
jgi:hypothetical protein